MTIICYVKALWRKGSANVIDKIDLINILGQSIGQESNYWNYGDKIIDENMPIWYRIFRKFNDE